MPRTRERKAVFVSSSFLDPTSLALRRRLVDSTGGESAGESRAIWMAEDYREQFPASGKSDVDKTILCLEGVRSADCFVAIVGDRYGTSIGVDGIGEVPTSFFEAELFEAALLGKPSFVYKLGDRDPPPRLKGLLTLLKPLLPDVDLRPVDPAEVERKIGRLLHRFQRPRWLRPPLAAPRIDLLVRTLFAARHRPYDVRTQAPGTTFLGGVFDPTVGSPDPGQVEAMLQRSAETDRNDLRLMYLWFAIRALMGAPHADPAFAHLNEIWSRTLGSWVTSAAWYGLHGHAAIGCLAALGSISAISLRSTAGGQASGIPHGALASEYYSQARLMGGSRGVLEIAMKHIQAAIQSSDGDHSGQLAIRASIFRRIGDHQAALADYRTVVDIRKERGDRALGEALSELGFAMMLSGAARAGVEKMEEGLVLLQQSGEFGFRIRAQRKLAIGYARQFRFIKSLELAARAYDLAVERGAFDQIRRLERLAKQIDRLKRRGG